MTFNCGRLFLTGLSGTKLQPEEKQFIKENDIAGVVLFTKNYESKEQLKDLIKSIQEISSEKKIIAVDHEGGRVQRFRESFTKVPSAKDIAESGSPTNCFDIYSKVGLELNEVGINLNFAPVTDLLTNPKCEVIGDRSFGSDVSVVSKFVSASIRGLQKNNIMACAKHFPGHGDTFVDSHEDLPRSERDFELMKNEDVQVFKIAFKNKVAFTMMAHMIIPELDNGLPVSLSKAAHQYLIKDLAFKGLVISDDMEMGAITKNYGAVESAKLALEAGTHLVEYRSFEACRDVVVELNKLCRDDKALQATLQERYADKRLRLNNFFL